MYLFGFAMDVEGLCSSTLWLAEGRNLILFVLRTGNWAFHTAEATMAIGLGSLAFLSTDTVVRTNVTPPCRFVRLCTDTRFGLTCEAVTAGSWIVAECVGSRIVS